MAYELVIGHLHRNFKIPRHRKNAPAFAGAFHRYYSGAGPDIIPLRNCYYITKAPAPAIGVFFIMIVHHLQSVYIIRFYIHKSICLKLIYTLGQMNF